MTLAAVRGATSVDADTPDAIASATVRLTTSLLAANGLRRADVISVFLTVTPDLVSDTPALALSEAGWTVPVLCAQDTVWAGAPPRVVRIMAHCRWERTEPPRPLYLGAAGPTRPGSS